MLTTDLIKLNNLQLAGKLISEELMLGLHGSKRTGHGVEFEQYKHYLPGDDLKQIDWKLYGKTGKLLVKESSTESNFHINLVLDLSGSMNYSENGVSRLQYCKIVLASLAYLGYRQGDPMSLYGLKNDSLLGLVGAKQNNLHSILYQLEEAKAAGEWKNDKPRFPELNTKRKELLILAGDFLQVDEEWVQLIKSIASPQRQIVIYQVLGEQELDFNLNGFYRFKDLETGKELELDAKTVSKELREASGKYLNKLSEDLKIANVNLFRVKLSKPIAEVLTETIRMIKTWNL